MHSRSYLLALSLVALAAVSVYAFNASRERDAYRSDLRADEITVDFQCMQLAAEIDEIVGRLADVDSGPGTDASTGFVQRDESLGLRQDRSLAMSRTYSWLREYLACGFTRAWASLDEQSNDADVFAKRRISILSSRDAQLVATLRQMSDQIVALRARPFQHGAAPRH